MINVILTSNGFVSNYPRSKEIDEMFKTVSQNKKVLIISNATSTGANFDQLEPVRNNFLNVGAKICDIVEISSDNESVVLDYEVIYMIGGHIDLLLNMIKNTNIKNNIKLFLEKGGIYIGESAGSFIATDSLEWVWAIKKGLKPKYDIEPQSFEGLGITNTRIYPHWNRYGSMPREKALNYDPNIIPLCDGEYIENYYERKIKNSKYGKTR